MKRLVATGLFALFLACGSQDKELPKAAVEQTTTTADKVARWQATAESDFAAALSAATDIAASRLESGETGKVQCDIAKGELDKARISLLPVPQGAVTSDIAAKIESVVIAWTQDGLNCYFGKQMRAGELDRQGADILLIQEALKKL